MENPDAIARASECLRLLAAAGWDGDASRRTLVDDLERSVRYLADADVGDDRWQTVGPVLAEAINAVAAVLPAWALPPAEPDEPLVVLLRQFGRVHRAFAEQSEPSVFAEADGSRGPSR